MRWSEELEMMRNQGYVTMSEAARIVGITYCGIHASVRTGRINSVRSWGHIYISKQDAERYIRRACRAHEITAIQRLTLETIHQYNVATGNLMTPKRLAYMLGVSYELACWRIRELRRHEWLFWKSHHGCSVNENGRKVLS